MWLHLPVEGNGCKKPHIGKKIYSNYKTGWFFKNDLTAKHINAVKTVDYWHLTFNVPHTGFFKEYSPSASFN